MRKINWNKWQFWAAIIVGVPSLLITLWKLEQRDANKIIADSISHSEINQISGSGHTIIHVEKWEGNLSINGPNQFLSGLAIAETPPPLLLLPNGFDIAYTDTENPRNPHALIKVTGVNLGSSGWINDIRLKWDIHDGYDRITPPDEWRLSQGEKPVSIPPVEPGRGFIYFYGPEIGGNTPKEYPENEKHLALKVHATYRVRDTGRKFESSWEGYVFFDKKLGRYAFKTEKSNPGVDYRLAELVSNQIEQRFTVEPGTAGE